MESEQFLRKVLKHIIREKLADGLARLDGIASEIGVKSDDLRTVLKPVLHELIDEHFSIAQATK